MEKNIYKTKLKDVIDNYDNYSKNDILEKMEEIYNKLNDIDL